MPTNHEARRFHITEAPAPTDTPKHERGVLQEVGHGIWLAATPPRDLRGFRWVIAFGPAGPDPSRRFDELDAMVARVLPTLREEPVLFVGEPEQGLAACAAAACVLAAGQRDHVHAALASARWPDTKLPKPVRRSLRDWWEARSELLPPTVESWDALRRVPAFDDAWDLLAMAPFNARAFCATRTHCEKASARRPPS